MKTVCKKIYDYFHGINGIIFIFYALFLALTQTFISTTGNLSFLVCSIVGLAFCILLCPTIINFASKLQFASEKSGFLTIKDKLWKVIFFVLPFLLLLYHYWIYYPVSFSPDSMDQYQQSLQNVYSNWHPIVHTLLAFKLPLTLTSGWTGSIVLFQILIFSAVIGYALCTVKRYSNTCYALIVMLFILINPETSSIALFPWKDVSFAIGAMLMVIYGIKVYFTKGEWLKKPLNVVCFVLTSVLTTLFRHNALLFTLPLIIAVLLLVSKKRAVAIAAICVVLITTATPICSALLSVEEPDKRQTETLGLPMNIIGSAVTYNPEYLDDDILEFAYKVAPQEVWQNKYEYGKFNRVKWDERTNDAVIEEYGTAKVIAMAARCITSCPRASLTGLIKLTEVVYTVSDNYNYCTIPYESSDLKAVFQKIDKDISVDFNRLFPHLFMYVGVLHLILLVSILAKCKLNKWNDWKKIFFVLPLVFYNFGSALLLTDASDSSR